ncbi:MAG: hypothetical protein HUJ61_03640, partial [Bacilli bacterium]|nr:hypothetical protein [Bacilli bacterium]
EPKFSANYGQVLPPKYENVEYKEPTQNYNVLGTIRNKTIVNDVITNQPICGPVKYLKPIYKQVVLKENPQDIQVVKNKTIYLNPGDPIPDLNNIESNPSVVASNPTEAHNLLHEAGLTFSTMPKAKVSKIIQSNYPIDNPQQISNANPDFLNTLGDRPVFQMEIGDKYDKTGKQSKIQFNTGSSYPSKVVGTQAHSTHTGMTGMMGQHSAYPSVNNSQPIPFSHSSQLGKFEPTMNVTKQTGDGTGFIKASQRPNDDSIRKYQQTNNDLNIPMVNSVEANPEMSSFPIGTNGNPPTSVCPNPNPFENPFSTVKGEGPSDPLNFPSAVKESKYISKSSGNAFKKK